LSGAATELSEADREGRACVQEILARCATRERASDSDWTTRADGVFCRAFPEGMLAKKKLDDDADEWILWWCASAIIRPLDRGPLADIECDTREIILFGPPGGPDDGSGPRVWCPDEGSLFATAIHGCFRLMVRPDGRGTLIFVRDDFSTLHLGDDSVEELKRTADRRLREHHGDPIRGWIKGRRFDFHGLGVRGVVGQVELMRGTWLFLVRAGDDRFDLYMVVGGQILDRVCSYTGSALAGGDLGQLFDRHDVAADEANGPASAGGGQRPRRTPPHHTGAPASHTRRAAPPPPATLSADQLGRIETCFSPTGPFDGIGSSEMGAVYAGLRVLARGNLPNMRLKTGGFRKLVMQEGKQQLGDCTKTFVRAAERVLEETKFGTRDGRWWDLPFADLRRPGSVVDRICAHFEPKTTPTAGSPPSSAAPPAATVPPSSAPPVSSTAAPAPVVPPSSTAPPAGAPVSSTTPSPSAEPPASPTAGPAATGPASSTRTPSAGPPVRPTAGQGATVPASSTPAPAGPSVLSTTAPAATVPASSTPSPPAGPSASSAPSSPAPSASSTDEVTSAPSSSTQPSAPSTPAVPPTPTDSPPAPVAPPFVEEISRATWIPPVPGMAAARTGLLIHPSCPDAPLPPVEIGPSPVGVDPSLEAEPLEVGDDPTPDELEYDGHWHRVLRQDGQPTFYEPLNPREQSDDGASRFPGIKARGPPKN